MTAQTSLNSQLLEAIERTNEIIDHGARQAATAIAFQEVVQSMAIAVQSSVVQLQSVFTLNIAATGGAFARASQDPASLSQLQAVLQESQETVQGAINNLARLVAETSQTLRDPPSSGPGSAAARDTDSSPETKATAPRSQKATPRPKRKMSSPKDKPVPRP